MLGLQNDVLITNRGGSKKKLDQQGSHYLSRSPMEQREKSIETNTPQKIGDSS